MLKNLTYVIIECVYAAQLHSQRRLSRSDINHMKIAEVIALGFAPRLRSELVRERRPGPGGVLS